jgi:hypothetical protein
MSKGKLIKINKNIVWRNIAERMVILNKKNDNRYVLNEIGLRVWEYITNKKLLLDAIDVIAQDYSVDRARIASDVDRFLQNLEREGIISVKVVE